MCHPVGRCEGTREEGDSTLTSDVDYALSSYLITARTMNVSLQAYFVLT